MDQFVMMLPLHSPLQLGADSIIYGARAVQVLQRSLNWTFHIYRRQTD